MDKANVAALSADFNTHAETEEISFYSDYETFSDNHESALLYAQWGLAIVPVSEGKPYVPTVLASKSLSQVDQWWRHNPFFEIGFVPAASNMTALQFGRLDFKLLSFQPEWLAGLERDGCDIRRQGCWIGLFDGRPTSHSLRTFPHTFRILGEGDTATMVFRGRLKRPAHEISPQLTAPELLILPAEGLNGRRLLFDPVTDDNEDLGPMISHLPPWIHKHPKEPSELHEMGTFEEAGMFAQRDPSEDLPATVVGPISFSQVLQREVPPVRELIPGLVEKGIVTMLAGPGGVHKSRTAVHWGLSLAAGMPVYGRSVERCSFVYLSHEDGDDQVALRAQGIARRCGIPTDLENAFYWDLRDGNQGLYSISEQSGVQPLPFADRLKAFLGTVPGHKFIVADSAYNVLQFAGNAKINEALVKGSLEALSQLCRATDSTMVLLWHPSQAGQARGDASGWSVAWHNAPRARLSLSEKRDGEKLLEGLYELRCEKRNNAAKGEPILLRWDDGVLTPPNLADQASQRSALLEACIRVAIMAARSGSPIQTQKKVNAWQLEEVARVVGRPVSNTMLKEELSRALSLRRLRYVPGKSKTIAGYFPFTADPDGYLPEAEYEKLLRQD